VKCNAKRNGEKMKVQKYSMGYRELNFVSPGMHKMREDILPK